MVGHDRLWVQGLRQDYKKSWNRWRKDTKVIIFVICGNWVIELCLLFLLILKNLFSN